MASGAAHPAVLRNAGRWDCGCLIARAVAQTPPLSLGSCEPLGISVPPHRRQPETGLCRPQSARGGKLEKRSCNAGEPMYRG